MSPTTTQTAPSAMRTVGLSTADVATTRAPTPIAPTPDAGNPSNAIPAASPATAMKVMASGANAARAPPDAARRARKHHVVRSEAPRRRLAIQPSHPTPAPTISADLIGWFAD